MKRMIALLAAALLLLSACSSATLDSASKELEDTITNVSDADNKYVLMVKGGYRTDNPSVTYEDAFSSFFTTPRWKYFEGTEGQDVVEFTGDCIYRDATVKARIQFVVDEENGTFEASYLAFNEVPQDSLTLAAVISKAFEEADAIGNENTDNSSSGNPVVRFKGIPLDDILHAPCTDITEMFGEPDTWGDNFEYIDDGITFYLDEIDRFYVTSFSSWHPADFEYNGHTFDGTLGELKELLGDYESLGTGGYYWAIGDYFFTFYIPNDTNVSEYVEVGKFDTDYPDEGDGPAYADIYDIDYALIGRWRSYSTDKSITLYEFGQVDTNWKVWDYVNDTPDRCLWTASNGRLQIDAIFETSMPYSIRTEDPYGVGAREYFYWGNEDTYAFSREDTGTNAIPGDWRSNPDLLIIAGTTTLYEDGTGYRGGKYFRWYADDTTYTEIQTQGRTYDYSVSGDTLTLFFDNGAEVFAKVGD